MKRIGVDSTGIELMAPKQFHLNLKIAELTPAQANILKQDALSCGGEAAVAKGAVSCKVEKTGCVLSGTFKQLKKIAEKLKGQTHGLSSVADMIERAVENISSEELCFKSRSRQWDVSRRTLIMGILNVTPDSFFDGGAYLEKDKAIERALKMVEEGADIIDVGGESSRPGAAPVAAAEELRRIVPVIEELSKKGVTVSVDTTKAIVAGEALEKGAEIINDISAMRKDGDMAAVAAKYGAGVVLMHMRGDAATMQLDTRYSDLMGEIFDYLSERVDYALSAGIEKEKIAVDPGIGFAKSAAGNLEIIRRLKELKALGRPVLVGTSRKSFIGKTLGAEADSRLCGTISTISAAILNGANIVRVHDVKEAKEAILMTDAIKYAADET